MALHTGNPFLDALGGPEFPLTDGVLTLSFVFGDTGTGGAWNDQLAWVLPAIDTWLEVANIRLDPETRPDFTVRFLKEKQPVFDSVDTLGHTQTPDFPTHNVSFNIDHPSWLTGHNPGGYMYQAFVHEIGHALGLEHPFDTLGGTGLFPGVDGKDKNGDPIIFQHDTGDFGLNSVPYTIMAVNAGPGADRDVEPDRGFAATPLAFDIAAIQTMYGAVANNDGDTTYYLRDDGGPGTAYRCIWDTSGYDTIEYDGNQFATIDLRAATLKNEEGGGGFLSRVVGESTNNNGGLTIAADITDFNHDGIFSVVIEHAVGGSGHDVLIGNEFANLLEGRDGSDQLTGGAGDDTLSGGNGLDFLDGGADDDTLIGGGDRDFFEFGVGWGHDTINDFVAGTSASPDSDVLAFGDMTGVIGLGQLRMTDVGADLEIEFAGNSILLKGIHEADLKSWNTEFKRHLDDGYISGATVFADANGNGQLDTGEASATTDVNGTFALTNEVGTLIAFGGVDTSTGLPFKGQLSAPEGSVAITPLTTLMVAGASRSDLLAAFNLPAGYSLTLGDPIAGLLAQDAGSAQVFVAGAKVIDTVIALGTAIAGLGGVEANGEQDAFAAIATAVNNLGAGTTLDLSDAATIADIFAAVLQQEGLSAPQVIDSVAAAIAASNATIDQGLALDGASPNLITDVSAAQKVLQTNHPPHAADDVAFAATGIGGTASADAAHGVLQNDSDPDGDSLTVSGFSGGSHGNLVINADGSYSYIVTDLTGPTGSHLHDVFTYGITDGHAGVALANLDITLNRAPSGGNDSNAVTKGGTISGNVLANDVDPDGDAIHLTSVNGGSLDHSIAGNYGAFTLYSDGSYSYIANKGGLPSKFVPQDTFVYGISDGHGGTAPVTLSVVVLDPSQSYLAGTNTTLNGSNGRDVLDGSTGHDILLGGNGPDVLIGGRGDTLAGGNGPDTFLFRPGFGANNITDFDVNNDSIQVDKAVFASVGILINHAHDSAAGVIIDDGAGDTITLASITLAQLQSHLSDFYLV